MPKIHLLSKETIDKIAAGEVVERPLNVVKELVENAIDAGASAVTIEIKNGGISYIRVTDNGSGIEKDDIEAAFLRHSTSKLRDSEDLYSISTLGFRGEALSSISAVSVMEIITKTKDALNGTKLRIEGGNIGNMEDVGAPDGTTMFVKNLFYNTPARKKFLKSEMTEGAYITSLVEHLALSHPEIAIRYILNGSTKINTSGHNDIKETIYSLYGRDLINDLIPINREEDGIKLTGYIAKPGISRGNRGFENFFVNGRYINAKVLTKAVEEGYRTFIMQHKFPIVFLYIGVKNDAVDVNVHPTKMEVKFMDEDKIYDLLSGEVKRILSGEDLILSSFEVKDKEPITEVKERIEKTAQFEPFEISKQEVIKERIPVAPNKPIYKASEDPMLNKIKESVSKDSPYFKAFKQEELPLYDTNEPSEDKENEEREYHFLDKSTRPKHKIIGQVFDTYWLVVLNDTLYIIDQHAAHERILFEKTVKLMDKKEMTSQVINPPMVISLNDKEMVLLSKYMSNFTEIGFKIEDFGGNEVIISEVPYNMFGINSKELFIGMIDELEEFSGKETAKIVTDKIAMMSCKAAVKGNSKLSLEEANAIIDELLALDNPYHCPHGRPTIIELTKSELERRFKR